MINKQLEEIQPSDIEALVSGGVPEDRTLEYKLTLPGNSADDKKEFLADVSSFANASGGDLVYGVEEDRDPGGKPTGLPKSAPGINTANAGADIIRLENIVRDSIEPRLVFHVAVVQGFTNGPVLVLRVAKSWAAPHMLKGSPRFFSRTSAGKYPLDVNEIRAAFALSEALPERLNRFRNERMARIVADETPVVLEQPERIVLHVLPVSSFETRQDFTPLFGSIRQFVYPIAGPSSTDRYNFDGMVIYSPTGNGTARGYVQLFRSGAMEAVDASLIQGKFAGTRAIPSFSYEASILDVTPKYLEALRRLGVEPPILVLLALVGVRGLVMSTSRWPSFVGPLPIDRDLLLIPECTVEEFSIDTKALLRPAFDAVWQAAGWPRDLNYNKAGE